MDLLVLLILIFDKDFHLILSLYPKKSLKDKSGYIQSKYHFAMMVFTNV